MTETQNSASGRAIDHVVLAVRSLDDAGARFEQLGFTLTKRAQHPWGTANRLAQLPGGNFIELLEIDRPELTVEHDRGRVPPVFSFGAHNRDFLAHGDGMSMLVMQTTDSRADLARYRAAGITAYAPFDFERRAPLPDGSEVTVAFSLALTTHPDMPEAAFFTCHNRFPENFWKPDFLGHANGAAEIVEVVMAAEQPAAAGAFLAGFTGGEVSVLGGGIEVSCGPHRLTVLTPHALAARYPGEAPDTSRGPRFAAVVIEGETVVPGIVPSGEAFGVLLELRRPG